MNLQFRNVVSLLAVAATLQITAGCQIMAADTAVADAGETVVQQDTADRYIHAPELGPIIMPYLNAQGFMDQDFPPTVASPSPYLTDFYGIQAIQDVAADQIVADFGRLGAKLENRDEHSISFRFPDGYLAQFYPMSSLSVVGQTVPLSHVSISGTTWRETQANLQLFRATIGQAGLTQKYFVPNPAFPLEKQVAAQFDANTRAKIEVDPDLMAFDRSSDSILFFPEGLHGKSDDADKLMSIMPQHELDWIAMEMLGPAQQDALDDFVSADEGSEKYHKARAALLEYFTNSWNGRAGPKVPPEQLYYFKMVEAARAQGMRVIGIERATLPFLLFRYGETKFGGAVRSLEWAKTLPRTGRGIVFGGSAHFSADDAGNVQDFVAVAQPKRPLFSLKPLTKKSD